MGIIHNKLVKRDWYFAICWTEFYGVRKQVYDDLLYSKFVNENSDFLIK